MKIEKLSEKLAIFFYFLCFLGSIIVIFFWFLEKPLFYTASGPVMSIFTALSLCILSGIRLAKRFLFGWPMTTTLGLMVFVMGGNISSVLMMTSFPHILADTQSSIVMTSVFTSLGILLFGSYELLLIIRKTPKHIFILDDILIHLALVPGGLSLLGHLLNNPAYISLGIDPRVGISLLEMS
ncbi:MAG: hypothetical protein KDK45_22250, partial [Leptospiraceae bacterium]|nr:hypothetical protein [Leptospiraceae bacterium]